MSYVGTTTPLAASGTYTSLGAMSNREDRVVGTVFADQGGTLFVEQGYPDASGTVNYDVSDQFAITASDGKGFAVTLVAPKWRVRFVNGATPQGAFRLHAHATSDGDS